MNPPKLSTPLLRWYQTQGRHDLPWKKPRSAYRVWVSEIMLQQTQVRTVIPYFQKFMQVFPTVEKLSQAPLDQVLHYWSGLGYYARARNLHKTAQIVTKEYHGQFPRTVEGMMALPGIGRSTAGAILAQAFDIVAPILDANVKRVLCRYHGIAGWPGQKDVEAQLWELATKHTPSQKVAEYTQAIMDLGATCCTRSTPHCHACPLATHCVAFATHTQEDYPTKKTKKAVPTRQVIMLVAQHKNSFLLEQRPLQGIWAGLWSLPEFDTQPALRSFLGKTLKISDFTLEPLPPLKHTFTHFHLQISPMLVIVRNIGTLPKQSVFAWVNTKGLTQRGLPTPVKKLIHIAKDTVLA